MQVEPYVYFNGRCEEAIEFYRHTLGAEVLMIMRFKDSPEPAMCSEVGGEKIMHSTIRIGESIILASDGPQQGKANFQGFSLSITVATEAEAEKLFAALGTDGGKALMPMSKTFFAKRFGMVEDRFGLGWMVLAM